VDGGAPVIATTATIATTGPQARSIERRPMASTIDRRLLVNWRADPAAIEPLLPAGFRIHEVAGQAVVGVCLIRLRHLRPSGMPRWLGITTESAAHRIAVLGPDHEPGVYVLRRDTDSRLAALAGGRLFPGPHTHGRVAVEEGGDQLDLAFRAPDGAAVTAAGHVDPAVRSALFGSLDAARDFFAGGSTAHSPDRAGTALDAVELAADRFELEPVALHHATSTIWDPLATLDSAFLMRDVPATWLPR
jgi:hypothetical protein